MNGNNSINDDINSNNTFSNNTINNNTINNNTNNIGNNNSNNKTSTDINIRTSFDDLDFNNKDPLFFSSGNEYMYRADHGEDDNEDDEDMGSGFIGGKKKKRDDFLIDGFDENSEEMIPRDKKKEGLFGYHKNGNKIMIFVGLVLITFLLCSVALVYYAGKHPKFINTDTDIKPTIVISIDSFRAEYLERGLTPNLQKFIDDNSFRAQYTTAQFPSKTFPNHYSIATGLYPEDHGIVSNHMYDQNTNKIFNAGHPESLDPSWWWGEPIWVTAKKSQIKTACYFWPGCGIKIKGVYPELNIDPFNQTVSSDEVFKQLYQWRDSADSKNTPPTLTMAYVHEVDDAGHRYGPNSKEVNQSISSMDKSIGGLIDLLKASNLYNQTNIIFVSDHGMIEIPSSKYIYLDALDPLISTKFFTPDAISSKGFSNPSPIISIFPNDTRYSIDYLYNELNRNKSEYVTFYKKDDIPEEFFFNSKSNDRIPPLLGFAKPGYSIVVDKELLTPTPPELGNHGYDPSIVEMHSIFIARGPNIKSSGAEDNETTTTLKSFKNIEIYNLLAKLIGVDSKNSAPNNGTSLLIDKLYKKK
ncbi:hypothetical protein DICPUDRAFT_57514 [Dictyostelium purpureum]|uniref:Uncharacterized protein n=1 Tax=Dictyostelium purpureum TaxID=5786 RepID=F0ZWD1_DICPU|nr:uncharacterized protein DICPUDRAFT_57514 [Dictyostelium purpureum]EGC31742.1 hypothetical protein DICPUDRAFT_57514 [Dictyostelium purpureum]|eukprot:XP_003291722.1 hypothetical protein DICPUDRAFT_57514 [Dictyostelium purpureum]